MKPVGRASASSEKDLLLIPPNPLREGRGLGIRLRKFQTAPTYRNTEHRLRRARRTRPQPDSLPGTNHTVVLLLGPGITVLQRYATGPQAGARMLWPKPRRLGCGMQQVMRGSSPSDRAAPAPPATRQWIGCMSWLLPRLIYDVGVDRLLGKLRDRSWTLGFDRRFESAS